jgi:hypothetical protein
MRGSCGVCAITAGGQSAKARTDMPRRPATITQADVARSIRAAKQAGASEVEVRMGERSKIIIRLSSTDAEPVPEKSEEIVL